MEKAGTWLRGTLVILLALSFLCDPLDALGNVTDAGAAGDEGLVSEAGTGGGDEPQEGDPAAVGPDADAPEAEVGGGPVADEGDPGGGADEPELDAAARGVEPEAYRFADDGTEPSELLDVYLKQLVESTLEREGTDLRSRPDGTGLEGNDAVAYGMIRPLISEVARGERQSTVLDVPLSSLTDSFVWTAESLGLDAIIADGEITEEAILAANATFMPDVAKVVRALLSELPYELYWFDKVAGVSVVPTSPTMPDPYYVTYAGDEPALSACEDAALSFRFSVSPDYAAGEYLVDGSRMARVGVALANAREVVDDARDLDAYERLLAFKDSVCDYADYDYDAAGDEGAPYGDPWQLISVFDGDDATKVVCEGYAKAFQYLCDLSGMSDLGVYCYSVTGVMEGGVGAGGHMWNVVRMPDGRNYLADVTNCDEGTAGYADWLFLAPCRGGSVEGGYEFQTERTLISYAYSEGTMSTYAAAELAISDEACSAFLQEAPTEGWAALGTCEYRVDGETLRIRPFRDGASGRLPSTRGAALPGVGDGGVARVVLSPGVRSGQNLCCAFEGCDNLRSIDFGGFDTSDARCMLMMFSGCSLIESLDLSGFDTSSVTSMAGMFQECSSLSSLDLSGFDTSSVTRMESMFTMCSSLSSLDVSGFDTSRVLSMSSMFGYCSSITSIDVSGWDTSSVVSLEYAFVGCSELASLDVSGWDTSSVRSMFWMLGDCPSIASLDVSGWDTSRVRNMSSMFNGCSSLATLDVSRWDTSGVEQMEATFCNCSALRALDVSGWDTSGVVNMQHMFWQCWSLSQLDVSGWDTSRVQHMYGLFSSCYGLTSLDVSRWDTSSAEYMSRMFSGCSELESLDVSGFDTSRVESMGSMFANCRSLRELDLSGWDTSSVTGMGHMFYGCSSLASLDLAGLDTSSVEDMGSMFEGCPSLSKVTLGERFSFCGGSDHRQCGLPSTGPWRSASTGEAYAWNEVPDCVADTYTRLLDISEADVSAVPGQTYTGAAVEPAPEVTMDGGTLSRGTDYTLSYANNTNVGTATITITGKGGYAGSTRTTFVIWPASIANATVSAISSKAYTGSAIRPMPTVKVGTRTLKSGTDYTLSYADNVNVGKATVTIAGKGNYTSSTTATFRIVASVDKATVSSIADQAYTGSPIKPEPTVKMGTKALKPGTDYALSYKDNTNVGTATVTVTGKGSYSGTKKVTFRVVAASVANATVSAIASQTYTGSAIKPTPTVKVGTRALKPGTDYALSYANNTKAGTATVTVIGRGNYAGTKTATFKVVQASISRAAVAKVADQAWTGKPITPSPKVTFNGKALVKGTDYDLSYRNNTAGGGATIILAGKGNFKGTSSVTFRIVEPASKEFPDVPKSHWAHYAIGRAAALGIINGYKDGTFGPSDRITRGQIAVMFWNASGKPAPKGTPKSFSDVTDPNAYYYKAVAWASSAGVVNGYRDGSFGPDDYITREQLAVMAANHAAKVGKKKVEGSPADYADMPDASKVSGFARPAVGWAYREGVLPVRTGRLDPQVLADRAQAAWVVLHTYDLVAE